MANLGPPAITGNTLFDRWCQLLWKTVMSLPASNIDLSGLPNFANDTAAAAGGSSRIRWWSMTTTSRPISAALAMAAGTSLTISSLALLVHSFRQLAVKLSGSKTPVLWRQIGWTTLALAGGVILLVAAVTMWMSAVPVGRGLRPF